MRRAFLCGEGCEHRKQWVEERRREVAGVFAIDVCAYAVLDNHLHVVLMLNDDVARGWSDEEVVRRWGLLFPPRGKDRKPLDVTPQWVQERLADAKWVALARERLNSLRWFMQCLKEPLARMANQEDQCKGTFLGGTLQAAELLDEASLLACAAYVDLNPIRAAMVETPESSDYTGAKDRIDDWVE